MSLSHTAKRYSIYPKIYFIGSPPHGITQQATKKDFYSFQLDFFSKIVKVNLITTARQFKLWFVYKKTLTAAALLRIRRHNPRPAKLLLRKKCLPH